MKSVASLAAALVGLSLLSSVAEAAPRRGGSSGGEPSVYTMRGITMGEGTLRLDVDLGFGRYDWPHYGDSYSFLNVGAAWSPVRNLELHALFLPLDLSPDSRYGSAYLGGAYVLAPDASFGSMGLSFGFRLNHVQQLHLGLPIRFNINPAFYIELHPCVDIALNDHTTTDLHIPVEFAVNVTPDFFFLARAGVNLIDLDADLGALNLGLGFGYTIPKGRSAFVDLSANLDFPYLVPLGDGFKHYDHWQVTLGANFHFDVR